MPITAPPTDPAIRPEAAGPALAFALDELLRQAEALGWTRSEACEALVWCAAQRLAEEAGPKAAEDLLAAVAEGVATGES